MIRRFAYCFGDWDYTVAQKVTRGIDTFLQSNPNVQVYCFHEVGRYDMTPDEPGVDDVFQWSLQGKFDGFVLHSSAIWPHEKLESFLNQLHNTNPGVPVVTVNDSFPGCTAIGTDNAAAEHEMVLSLLKRRQVTRITRRGLTAVFAGSIEEDPEMKDRSSGFLAACKEAGLPDKNVQVMDIPATEQAGRELASDLVRKKSVPDLLCLGNDLIAFGGAKALKDAGYNIPRDVIVTGFENFDLANRFDPRLPSVDRDCAAMVQTALNLLYQVCENGLTMPERLPAPYKIFYETVLSDGTTLGNASRAQLRDNLVAGLQTTIQDRESEKNYYRARDDMEKRLGQARSIADIMEAFETFAPRFEWGDLYLGVSQDYNEELTSLQVLKGQKKERMDLRALVLDPADPTRSTFHSPDPNTHIYESYKTNDILPRPLSGNKQLVNLFSLSSGDIPIAYLAIVGDAKRLNYRQIGGVTQMLINAMASCRTQRQLSMLNAQLSRLSTHDALTGLYNRLGLETLGRQKFTDLQTKGGAAFWFVDVDNLKFVNDTFGHAAGDELLVNTAGILERCGQIYNCFVCRYGGDEFIMMGDFSVRGLKEMIEQSVSIMKLTEVAEGLFHPSVSIGRFDARPGNSMEAAIQAADRQMYEIKKKRKTSRYDPCEGSRFVEFRRKGLIRAIDESVCSYEDLISFLKNQREKK